MERIDHREGHREDRLDERSLFMLDLGDDDVAHAEGAGTDGAA